MHITTNRDPRGSAIGLWRGKRPHGDYRARLLKPRRKLLIGIGFYNRDGQREWYGDIGRYSSRPGKQTN